MKKSILGDVAKVVGGVILCYGAYLVVKAAVTTVQEYLDDKNAAPPYKYTSMQVSPDTKMSDIAKYFDEDDDELAE